jgi:hypothetical protein
MGYLGQETSLTGTQNYKKISVVATAGQKNFIVPGGYSINAVDVYRNGIKLVGQRDFVALDAVTVTLTQAASVNDILEFSIFENFQREDVISGDGDSTINGNLQVSGDLGITGTLNASVSNTLTAGIATEAVRAGMSTEATSAGIATFATTAGIATFATTAGIATFATTAGIATQLSGYLGVGVTGANLNVTGVITATSFSGNGSALTGIAATDNVNTSTLVVAGISTFSSGISVSGVVTATSFSGSGANLSGVGTQGSVLVADTASVTGVSTFANVIVGQATTQFVVNGDARITGVTTFGTDSITINPSGNVMNVGAGITIHGYGGLAVSGILTANGVTVGQNAIGARTVQSGGSPSGGADGDIYYIY